MEGEIVRLDPARTALVIVDMQNDFCHSEGFYARMGRDVAALASAVEPCRQALSNARAAGAQIVFTRLLHDPALGAMEERHRLRPK
jgi:biuret amidohydrolase